MQDLSAIPKNTGVYLYKNKAGEIIYVGKAKNLRNRVRSYFSKQQKHPRTELLVRQIHNIDFIIVDSEVEALLLENRLIKKHQPRYNVALKDAKTYAYIKLTGDTFPRILSTRRLTKSGTYFGPYTDGSARNELVQLAVSIFKLRVCKTLPKRACLNYHIGLCTAPCIGKVTKADYGLQVKEATAFLKGNTKGVLKKLEQDMKTASERQLYEIALEKKRQIDAIYQLENRQKVDTIKQLNQHVVAAKQFNKKMHFVLFSINKGVIAGKKEYNFELQDDLFESFIKLYYSQNTVPHEIIVSEPFWTSIPERATLEAYLSKIKGSKVKITYPIKGEKKALYELALKNIAGTSLKTLIELQNKLNLPQYPQIIECFDISNLGREHIVGAMTQWVDGNPNKSAYRKFEIKTKQTQDDFASMHEVVLRRYKRLSEEHKQLPNLIVIDGGPGQLNAALQALSSLGLHIPIIGLAKKEEEIYLPGESTPLSYDKNSEMMLMLRKIRDSVHRFVLAYNRKKREMKMREDAK